MSRKVSTRKPSPKNLQKQLVGTWKLISAEDKNPKTGKQVPYTFGNPPSGYFIYDATGHASIQIMTTPPVKLASPDSPTPAEAWLSLTATLHITARIQLTMSTLVFKLKVRGIPLKSERPRQGHSNCLVTH